MSYDKDRKMIAKFTGLTGIEAKNIATQLERQGLDYMSFDWQTIGSDLYGHGKRVEGVKHHLREMYGISLQHEQNRHEEERYNEFEVESLMPSLMEFNDRRKKKAKMMDWNINAKHTYKPSNKKGVARWRKHPNMFDIIGIDDKI